MSSTFSPVSTSPHSKRAYAPSTSQDYDDTKFHTSPKPLPRSNHNVDYGAATGVGSKSKPPVTAPKPVAAKGDYLANRPASPTSSEFGSIPRSSSFGQSPLSALLNQVVVAPVLQRSSSMDENLNSSVHHPLNISPLASKYSCASLKPIPHQVPPPAVPSPPSSMPSSTGARVHPLEKSTGARVNVMGAGVAEPPAQAEGEGEADSGQVPLASFLKQRQKDLPLQVRVCNGYQGQTESDSLSSGDVLFLLFLKHTEVIEAEQLQDKYYIPLNSAVNARIPYRGGLNAYKFSVSEIMASNEPPLVMKAVTRYQSSSDKSSVEEDEVFVVEGIKSVMVSRYLQVYSMTHQVTKKLKVDCSASFTTNAAIYMSDVVQYLSAKFPLQVVLYFNQDANLSNVLSEREVTLCKHEMRTTVITSLCGVGENNLQSRISSLVEVPMETDITVLDLYLDKHDRKALIAQTKDLLKTFDTSVVSVLSTDGRTVELVRKGHERSWYRLDVPPSLAVSEVPDPTKERSETNSDSEEDAGNYEQIDPSAIDVQQVQLEEKSNPFAPSSPDVGSLAVQVNVMRRSVENMQSQSNMAESLSRSTKNQVSSIKTEIAELKSYVAEMGKALAALTERVESVFNAGKSHACMDTGHADDHAMSDQQEKVPLVLLSKAQVLALLKSMGLEQYQESFQAEEVDGAILAECDEHVLQHELGVTSKIHQIRLMKVIKEKAVTNSFRSNDV
ncbi:hypothetical protein EMCRGX_G008208 [Ephydatia muelleri]|eukprot:Em0002g308a